MALSVTARILALISDQDTEGTGSITDALTLTTGIEYTDAAGASGAQVQWNDYRTLAGTSENLDLAGVLVNRKGKTVTFTDLKGIAVRTPSTNTGNITLKGDSANGWNTLFNDDIVLPPNTIKLIATGAANGWAVTAGTGDILTVAGTVSDVYEIALWGEGTEA